MAVSPIMGYAATEGSSNLEKNFDSNEIYLVPSMDSSEAILEPRATKPWKCSKCLYSNVDVSNERCAMCGSENQYHDLEYEKKHQRTKFSFLSMTGALLSPRVDEEEEKATKDSNPSLLLSPSPPRWRFLQSSRTIALTRPAREEEEAEDNLAPPTLKRMSSQNEKQTSISLSKLFQHFSHSEERNATRYHNPDSHSPNIDDVLDEETVHFSNVPSSGNLFGELESNQLGSSRHNQHYPDDELSITSSIQTITTSNTVHSRATVKISNRKSTSVLASASPSPESSIPTKTIFDTKHRHQQYDDKETNEQNKIGKNRHHDLGDRSAAFPPRRTQSLHNSSHNSRPYHSEQSTVASDSRTGMFSIQEDVDQSSYLPASMQATSAVSLSLLLSQPFSTTIPRSHSASPAAMMMSLAPPVRKDSIPRQPQPNTTYSETSAPTMQLSSARTPITPLQIPKTNPIASKKENSISDAYDGSSHHTDTTHFSFTSVVSNYEESMLEDEKVPIEAVMFDAVGHNDDMAERGQVWQISNCCVHDKDGTADDRKRRNVMILVFFLVGIVAMCVGVILIVRLPKERSTQIDSDPSFSQNDTLVPGTGNPGNGSNLIVEPPSEELVYSLEQLTFEEALFPDHLGNLVSLGGTEGDWIAMVGNGFVQVVDYFASSNSWGLLRDVGQKISVGAQEISISSERHRLAIAIGQGELVVYNYHEDDSDWKIERNLVVHKDGDTTLSTTCSISGNGLVVAGGIITSQSTAKIQIYEFMEEARVKENIWRESFELEVNSSDESIHLELSYDGDILAIMTESKFRLQDRDGQILLLAEPQDDDEKFTGMALSGDGTTVALTTRDKTRVFRRVSPQSRWTASTAIISGGVDVSLDYEGNLVAIGNPEAQGRVSLWQLQGHEQGSLRYELSQEIVDKNIFSKFGTSVSITRNKNGEFLTAGAPGGNQRQNGRVYIYRINSV